MPEPAVASRVCSVDGCSGAHSAKGLCRRHYERQRPRRPDRHLHRGAGEDRRRHYAGLVDLTHSLVRLEVCQSLEEAVSMVVLLDTHWPADLPRADGFGEATFTEPGFNVSSFHMSWAA